MTLCKSCPKCQSLDIQRLKRGFFKKYILKKPRTYQCYECKHVFIINDPDQRLQGMSLT